MEARILPPACVFKQDMNASCAAVLGYSVKDAMHVKRLTQSFLMSPAMSLILDHEAGFLKLSKPPKLLSEAASNNGQQRGSL